jgi:hypothetical protein
MDFLLGCLITLIVTFITFKYYIYLDTIRSTEQKYRFSQSSLHEMIKPLLPPDLFKPIIKKTQSSAYEERTNLRVIILDGYAYWIKDNKFYKAPTIGQNIDKDSAVVVDIMGLDRVQLDKMLFIMDRLREGLDNDSGSTGN